jgi:predicted DNA binding CopG/RHH family protein
MSKKIKYTDGPIDVVEVVDDFLPSPEQLAFKDDTVKVTLLLSKNSVDFFKNEANKYNTKYQKMIRNLLDQYTIHHIK